MTSAWKTTGKLSFVMVFMLVQIYACKSEMEETVRVKPEGPVAIARTTQHFGKVPLEIELSAADSYVHGDGDLTYTWDWDDGSSSEGVSTKHTFEFPGTYMVTLNVTDSTGEKDADTITIIVD
jgi:PKD repeat protein